MTAYNLSAVIFSPSRLSESILGDYWSASALILAPSRVEAKTTIRGLTGLETALNTLCAGIIMVVGVGRPAIGLLSGRMELASLLTGLCAGRLTITDARLTGLSAARIDLGQGKQTAILAGRNILVESATTFHNVVYDFLLNGISIKKWLTGANYTYNEESVHNEVNLDSTAPELWQMADPTGVPRLDVTVGSRTINFLIERRSGSETGFSLWGRSITALYDAPFVAETVHAIGADTLASEIAASLVSPAVVSWQVVDWLVPDTWQHKGTPVTALVDLAQQVGGIVRSQDDGSFLVRRRSPVRPINLLDGYIPVIGYDRMINLIELSVEEAKGTGAETIVIYGYSEEVKLPVLEIEEGTREPGDDVFVRVCWAGQTPAVIPEDYATSGAITLLARDQSEALEETIDFVDGKASVAKPITKINSIIWLGAESAGVDFDQNATDLYLQDTGEPMSSRYRVAKISYNWTYWRYRLSGSNLARLLMVLAIPSRPDVSVRVNIAAGIKEIDSIQAPLLTSQAAAVARGIAELDKVRYDTKTLTIQAPHDDAVIDGVLADCDNGVLTVNGRGHVRSVTTKIDGPQVTDQVEVILWKI